MENHEFGHQDYLQSQECVFLF